MSVELNEPVEETPSESGWITQLIASHPLMFAIVFFVLGVWIG